MNFETFEMQMCWSQSFFGDYSKEEMIKSSTAMNAQI